MFYHVKKKVRNLKKQQQPYFPLETKLNISLSLIKGEKEFPDLNGQPTYNSNKTGHRQ